MSLVIGSWTVKSFCAFFVFSYMMTVDIWCRIGNTEIEKITALMHLMARQLSTRCCVDLLNYSFTICYAKRSSI